MQLTEEMLAPIRQRFGDADGALPVARLKDLYNEVLHGILPLFDERKPIDYWKHHVRAHGMRPTGREIFGYTDWPKGTGRGFALVLAFVDRLPRLPASYCWQALAHCHAGVALDYINMIAVELTPNPEVEGQLRRIADRWSGSSLLDPALVAPEYKAKAEAFMAEYRGQLAALGVQWTGSSPSPRDALYPIDATQEALDRLALNPPRLWAVSQSSAENESIRPVILLLSENSD